MANVAEHPLPATREPLGPAMSLLAAAFAGTVLLSAFLLFQVQPLVSKAILPWFGGSPAVWTTCMLFFEVVLFGGYAYAHALNRFVRPNVQWIVHAVLLAVALVFLPVLPSDGWKPATSEQPTLRILLLLSGTVGVPYFLLSTTGPLIQSWFALAMPGRSPYRLYALSNAGSLIALLSFPVLFEPRFELGSMGLFWSVGFVLFAAGCVYCGFQTNRLIAGSASVAVAASQGAAEYDAPPSFWRRLSWILLPAWATWMLLAMTNHVCQDVAVMPLLWVVPLSVYLLTFIISFDHPRWYARPIYAPLTAVAVFLVAGINYWPDDWFGMSLSFVGELALYFGSLFLVCMLCHGELARLKPAPSRLTEYFLCISAGGALGGVFVSIVAPVVFNRFYEWDIGVLGSLVGAFLLTGDLFVRALPAGRLGLRIAVLAGCVGIGVWGTSQAAYWQLPTADELYSARNFYGHVAVDDRNPDDPRDHRYSFVSGVIDHGQQYQAADRRREPLAYYGPHTGLGRAIRHFDGLPEKRVGVVGMGVATLAAYARPGDYYRFYEINPQVEYLAHQYFTFLKDCPSRHDVVLGDARLALEREEPQRFHVLVLDAFSGDAVPAHLLTKESLAVYLRHLDEHGILAFHITNKYLNLVPVVEGLARHYDLRTTRLVTPYDPDRSFYRSDYLLATRDAAFVAANPPELLPDSPRFFEVSLWTDRFSNVFQLLKR